MHRMIDYIRNEMLADRERWILWAPVFFASGIALYFALPFEPPLYAGALAVCGLPVFLAAYCRNKAAVLLWLPFFLCAAGFTAAQVRTLAVAAPVLERETRPLMLEGVVVKAEALPAAWRIEIADIRVAEGRAPEVMPVQARIKLKANDPAVPAAGDKVAVRAILLPLSPPVMPGAFDFQRHAFFKGLGATGYAIGDLRILHAHEEGFFFDRLRQDIRARIVDAISDPDRAAIVTALLVGESKGISEKTWETVRLSGIAHLLAISGFHITLVGGVVFFLARAALAAVPRIALRWPVKKIAAFIAILAAVFYTLLIGAPVPAVRATIMLSVVMAAVMLDRDPFTLRLAAFAALAILLLSPESLVGPSFQLSFAAVIALIAFYESIRNWWGKEAEERSWVRRYSLYILGCFLTTLVASAATGPFALFHFARMPLLSGLAANMIAVPVSSFVTMPAGIIACFLMPLGLEEAPLWIADRSVELMLETAAVTARWPHAVFHADAWPAGLLAMIALGMLWICIWRRRLRWLGVLPILAAAVAIPFVPRPDILAAGGGDRLFAVRDDAGKLWVSSTLSSRFVRGEWEEREGGAGMDNWKKAPTELLSCDAFACLYRRNGYTASFVFRPEAVVEDCARADILFSHRNLEEWLCPGKIVVDKWGLRDEGAHAVYMTDKGLRVETVAKTRGQRPWSGGILR